MTVRLGLGIAAFPFETPRAFFRWVDLCEGGGVDSLWQTDRLVSREPHLESLSAMAALAGATERMKFGMNAMVASLRDPLVAAKQCATIDFLSGGRLLPVFVPGHDTAPEWEATGRDPRERGRLADEILEIMRRLWSEEMRDASRAATSATATSRSRRARCSSRSRSGSAATARRRCGAPPAWAPAGSPASCRRPSSPALVVAIRRELARAGRSIDPDHYGVTLALPLRLPGAIRRCSAWSPPGRRGRAPPAWLAVGDAAAVTAALRAYVEAGASKFVLIPLARGEEDLVLQTRRLVDEVLPAFEAPAPARAAAG